VYTGAADEPWASPVGAASNAGIIDEEDDVDQHGQGSEVQFGRSSPGGCGGDSAPVRLLDISSARRACPLVIGPTSPTETADTAHTADVRINRRFLYVFKRLQAASHAKHNKLTRTTGLQCFDTVGWAAGRASGMGVNATGTLRGVAGRAPKTRESRRRRRRRGGVWGGAVPLPRKFKNSYQNGVIWCILGVLFLRFMCPMDCSCRLQMKMTATCGIQKFC